MADLPRYKAAKDLDRWRIQERCAKQAMDRNLLVVLPTGSGKTLIAIMAIEMTLERERTAQRTRSIIFLAPHSPLVEQQAKAISDELELHIMGDGTDRHDTIGICGSRLQAGHDDFGHVFESCQVLACTPMKLLHALQQVCSPPPRPPPVRSKSLSTSRCLLPAHLDSPRQLDPTIEGLGLGV